MDRSQSRPADHAGLVARLETIFEHAPVGIGIVELDGRTGMTNELLRRSLGYTAEELAAMAFSEFTHPDDVQPNLDLFERLSAGEILHFSMEKRFIRKDGGLLWAELTVSAVTDADGRVDYVIGMTQDITERKRLESDLRAAEQRYRLLVEQTPAVVYIAEPGVLGRWLYVSPQIEAMLGFTAEEWMADPGAWQRQLHPDDIEAALAEEDRAIAMGAGVEMSSDTYRMRHRDGRTVWVRDDAMVLMDADGTPTFNGVLVDVTREKRLEEQFEHQALHDPLTGLPNRKLFHDRVGRALERAESRRHHVAVLFVDLDNFKTVNDTLGHAWGDEVIIGAARRLERCVREGDTAARLGGDEFAMLVEGLSLADLTDWADRVLGALVSDPLVFTGHSVTIGASIGIAVAGPDDTAETLLRSADLAMYQAKQRGRGRHVVYEPHMHAKVAGRFRLETRLHDAVTEGRLTVAYQPIARLDSGDVVGMEALARWCDPELGHVSPAEFIPVAEQTGLIHELGRTMMAAACADLAQWRARTGRDAYVSVNVSPVQLDADDFSTGVLQTLAEHDLSPSSMVLEVTEGLLLVERSCASLRELRAAGVRVAIDDFGTGFSSLAYLRHLPVDMVKIDQSFLRPTAGDTGDVDDVDDHGFLNAIVALAQTLNLDSVCEGVETGAQLRQLQQTDCAFGQGYLLARPVPAAEIEPVIDVVRLSAARVAEEAA